MKIKIGTRQLKAKKPLRIFYVAVALTRRQGNWVGKGGLNIDHKFGCELQEKKVFSFMEF